MLAMPTLLNSCGAWEEPRTWSLCWRTNWTVQTYWTCCPVCCRRSSLSACCWSGVGPPLPSLSGSGTLPQKPATENGGHSVIQSLYDTKQLIRYITLHKIHNNLHEPFSIIIWNLSPREGTCKHSPKFVLQVKGSLESAHSCCSDEKASVVGICPLTLALYSDFCRAGACIDDLIGWVLMGRRVNRLGQEVRGRTLCCSLWPDCRGLPALNSPRRSNDVKAPYNT